MDINLITVNEYFELLGKNELTEKELNDKNNFERFIKECEEYPELISPAVSEVYSEYQKGLSKVYIKDTKTSNEENLITSFESKLNEKNQELEEEQTLKRTLDKAGYVNAIIILAMILNIGIIVAAFLLGSK